MRRVGAAGRLPQRLPKQGQLPHVDGAFPARALALRLCLKWGKRHVAHEFKAWRRMNNRLLAKARETPLFRTGTGAPMTDAFRKLVKNLQ